MPAFSPCTAIAAPPDDCFTISASGTLMIDNVQYTAPLGPLGRAVDALGLEQYTRRLMDQRNAWLKEELESRRQ